MYVLVSVPFCAVTKTEVVPGSDAVSVTTADAGDA